MRRELRNLSIALGAFLVLAPAVTGAGVGAIERPARRAASDDPGAAFRGPVAASTANATTVSILAGSATPSTVQPGTTVTDQHATVYLTGVSADGDPDTHYVAFPDAFSNLSVNGATVTGSATVVSTALVDGFDADGTVDSIAVETNASGGGTVPLAVTVNVSVTYPSAATTYAVHSRTVDSTGANATERSIATITATRLSRARTISGEQPTITGFQLNATEQDVDVVVSSTEDLEKLKVKVKGKAKNVTLTRSDFAETTRPPTGRSRFDYHQDVNVFLNNISTGDVGKIKVKVKSKVKKVVLTAENATDPRHRYVYRADVSDGRDGTFSAHLLQASSDGRNATVGHRDELTVATARRGRVFVGGVVTGAASVALVLLTRWWHRS